MLIQIGGTMEKRKKQAIKTTETKSADWTTLKGKYFHTFDGEGYVKLQGQIIDLVGEDIAIVLYFEVYEGTPTSHKAVWVSDIVDEGWMLYDTHETMQEAYDLEFVKFKPKEK
jgi:hypothetical protein